MLSNDQKAIIKRAQRECLIDDDEYRDILHTELGFGVRSSTDPRLGDRHFDRILAYFEAIYWRKITEGQAQRVPNSVFSRPGYWASKNTVKSNSRERYAQRGLQAEIARLETQLYHVGVHPNYLNGIARKTGHGTWNYKAALARTLAAKMRQQVNQEEHA
jgi:hypothetical protein